MTIDARWFDAGADRRGTGSYKWDSDPRADLLPMWVADMDFRTAPAITEALKARVEQGVFGYTLVGDDFYDAVTGWFAERHGWTFDRRSMIYTSGVVPALSAIIKALCEPGDKVIVQTPVYNCFFSSIRNNGCEVLANPLLRVGNSYEIDFADLEAQASDPRARLLVLCNPANPAGRVWTVDELSRIDDICRRHGVTVVSDEIHCELVYPGYRYVPFATVATAPTVSCVSPSKAFNIAGLQIAVIVAPDDSMRRRIDRAININEVCDVNPFGVIATVEAYRHGREWLEQLLAYLDGNRRAFVDYCAEHLPDFPLCRLEATYLMWMDCRRLGMSSADLEEKLRADTGLWLNAGTMYGADGEGYMRWNIACPRSQMLEGLSRFAQFIIHNS